MREEIIPNVQRPCKKCYIVALQADLQYADGRSANINQGAWLHHVILTTLVKGTQQDWVCPNTSRSDAGPAYRFFASGNERTAIRLNSKHKYGLNFPDTEMFHLGVEIMNQSDRNETYYVSMVGWQNVRRTIGLLYPRCTSTSRKGLPDINPRLWCGSTLRTAERPRLRRRKVLMNYRARLGHLP